MPDKTIFSPMFWKNNEVKNRIFQAFFTASIASLSFTIATEKVLAATWTYDISRAASCSRRCIGEVTVTGTVTTDALGLLNEANLVDWSLNFNSTNQSNTLLNPTNSQFSYLGSILALEATPTQLLFTSPPEGGPMKTISFNSIVPNVVWQLRGGGVTALEVINNAPGDGTFDHPSNGIFDQGFKDVKYGATSVIGTRNSQLEVVTTPEPGSLLGFITLGGLMVGSSIRQTFKSKF